MALLEWKAEVHRVEQEQMRRASTDQLADGAFPMSTADVPEAMGGIHQEGKKCIRVKTLDFLKIIFELFGPFGKYRNLPILNLFFFSKETNIVILWVQK